MVEIPLRRGEAGAIVRGALDRDLLVWDPPRGMFVPRQYVQKPTAPGSLLVSDANGDWIELRGTTPGQVLAWGSSGAAGFSTGGVGAIQPFAVSPNTVGLWLLNESLADSSGNGFHLSVETGTEQYCDVVPGRKRGFYFNGSTRLWVSTFQSALALGGEMSFVTMVQLDTGPTSLSSTILCSHGASGETQAANYFYTWGVALPVVAGTPKLQLRSVWEQGAGVDVTHLSGGNLTAPPIHNVMQVGASRSATGVVRFYLNGLPMGVASAPSTLPNGGTSGRLRLGGSDANSCSEAVMFGAKIVAAEWSADDFKNEYNRTMGPGFGLVS